ncbi:coiled-coil and C2 domain-containing protein 1A-like [Engraulis encrasicolus]|uniref:coiled-coil and C2 domain-containing protein 1A-like n=1 Tax=Engraulis encrasicolus TaxID=184585 RepID=UPI002FD27F0A
MCSMKNTEGFQQDYSAVSQGQVTGSSEAGTYRLTSLCMKLAEEEEDCADDDDEEDLDDPKSNADLLAELNELLKQDGTEDSNVQPQSNGSPLSHSLHTTAPSYLAPSATAASEGLQPLLIGRIDVYRVAIHQAEADGPASRERRYRRGLKTLETLLELARRGHPVIEAQIPPPLPAAHSKPSSAPQTEQPAKHQEQGSCPHPAMTTSDDDKTIHSVCTGSGAMLQVLARLKQYKVAAVQAKQDGHVQLAKRYYLTAKKLESIVEASKEGGAPPPDIRSLPPPPGHTPEPSSSTENDSSPLLSHTSPAEDEEEEDHATAEACWEADAVCGRVEDRTRGLSESPVAAPQAEDSYTYLIELLFEQKQRCLAYCQQFSHMGNIEETTRFEELAERSEQSAEALRECQRRGCPVPQYHMEGATVNTFRINPDLTGSELELSIIKGINLPVATGSSASVHEDTSVRFEFQFPSIEEAQKGQTSFVRDDGNPVFNEHFKLLVKKDHRALKRVVQSKGIKLEIVRKEGLFKADKMVYTAQLKLETLETHCDLRQLIEVMHRRKATGGHLEVQVRVREPLGGPQPHTVTEQWLVLDSSAMPMIITPKSRPQEEKTRKSVRRSSACLLL